MKVDIADILKVESHLHLEGAIRKDTYIDLRRIEEPSFQLENVPWYNESYRFNDLDHFLETASPCVTKSPEIYKRIAAELFIDIAAQNVVYTEMTIASTRIPVEEIAHAIHEAWQETKMQTKIEYGILVGLFRSDPSEVATDLVKQAVKSKTYRVIGVDLLEHETSQNADAFSETYGLAREAGLGLRAHAGEGAGSKSVWDVIQALGVSRIAQGYGVKSCNPTLGTHLFCSFVFPQSATDGGVVNAKVIVITHDPEVAAYAERVITLRDGQILKEERNA